MEQKTSIYKIGMKVYEDRLQQDKNSGTYELQYIHNALNSIAQTIVETNTLIIVGGKLFDEDTEKLAEIMPQYDIRIFVATDSVNFLTCNDIINQCDYILHQSPRPIPELIPQFGEDRQMYGYMPELFFVPLAKAEHQKNMAIFGGNNLRRMDMFEKYILDADGSFNEGIFALYKNSGGDAEDMRLEYSSYINLARLFKYNLIIVREEYRPIGWVTSRFVEAAACWNYPLVDETYDKYGHFTNASGSGKVSSYEEMLSTMKYFNEHEDERLRLIGQMREKIMMNCNKFVEVIYNVCTR